MTSHPLRGRWTRRQLLGLSAATVGSLPILAGCRAGRSASAGSGPAPDAAPPTGVTAPAPRPNELPQPPRHRSDGSVLDITMTAAPAVVDIGAAMPVHTSAYDGALPGSTWELDPGQTLRVELINDLPPLDHADHTDTMNRPHAWTTTNLHTHGLHVSPEGDGDNVFITIEPGERHQYEIEVPDDHPGGLFWYHPHRHGGVAQQLRSGMAGAIIVRGELDRVPEVAAAEERLMVIQAIELDDEFEVPAPIPDPSKIEAFYPRSQILYPINGLVDPTITMRPGELQRWRIVNAAEGKFMNLVLSGVELHVLAWDGLTVGAPEQVTNLFMSPGNRVDVLVRALEPGTQQLELTPSSSQRPGSQGVPSPTTSSLPPELVTRPIASVVIEGDAVTMALPTALPEWDQAILPIARRRQVEYSVQRIGLEFSTFGVDGAAFVPTQTPYRVHLNTAEEWTVVNGADHKLPQHAHVFHIHVNPFKVTRINDIALERPLWRDTFVLTGTTGDSFTFETNFVDFTGRFVDHCHIVSHEDLGMMEIVEVVP